MADTEKKINVVEIMKKIHREADDLYGKDEANFSGDKPKIIDFRSKLKLEGRPFIESVYSETFGKNIDDNTLENYFKELQSGKSKDSIVRKIVDSAEKEGINIIYYGLTEYDAVDFTKYNDIAFINNIYYKLLMRSPDPKGANIYLYRLQSKAFSKEEIVKSFAESEEGVKHGVKVIGLSKTAVYGKKIIRHIPVINKIYERKIDLAFAVNQAKEIIELKDENKRINNELKNVISAHQRSNMMLSRQIEKLEAEIEELKNK